MDRMDIDYEEIKPRSHLCGIRKSCLEGLWLVVRIVSFVVLSVASATSFFVNRAAIRELQLSLSDARQNLRAVQETAGSVRADLSLLNATVLDASADFQLQLDSLNSNLFVLNQTAFSVRLDFDHLNSSLAATSTAFQFQIAGLNATSDSIAQTVAVSQAELRVLNSTALVALAWMNTSLLNDAQQIANLQTVLENLNATELLQIVDHLETTVELAMAESQGELANVSQTMENLKGSLSQTADLVLSKVDNLNATLTEHIVTVNNEILDTANSFLELVSSQADSLTVQLALFNATINSTLAETIGNLVSVNRSISASLQNWANNEQMAMDSQENALFEWASDFEQHLNQSLEVVGLLNGSLSTLQKKVSTFYPRGSLLIVPSSQPNDIFIVPSGVTQLFVTACAGGAGGGGTVGENAGGGGACVFQFPIRVENNVSFSLAIGKGGQGYVNTAQGATNGGSTVFGSSFFLEGGNANGSGGTANVPIHGVNGGTATSMDAETGVVGGSLFGFTSSAGNGVFGAGGFFSMYGNAPIFGNGGDGFILIEW